MIFVHPLFDNFCYNNLFHTHIMFLLSLSIALVFVSILIFLCKIMVVPTVVNQMVVQITQLRKVERNNRRSNKNTYEYERYDYYKSYQKVVIQISFLFFQNIISSDYITSFQYFLDYMV